VSTQFRWEPTVVYQRNQPGRCSRWVVEANPAVGFQEYSRRSHLDDTRFDNSGDRHDRGLLFVNERAGCSRRELKLRGKIEYSTMPVMRSTKSAKCVRCHCEDTQDRDRITCQSRRDDGRVQLSSQTRCPPLAIAWLQLKR